LKEYSVASGLPLAVIGRDLGGGLLASAGDGGAVDGTGAGGLTEAVGGFGFGADRGAAGGNVCWWM
jgi:hypothetical protein